jgi:hypothetical protein
MTCWHDEAKFLINLGTGIHGEAVIRDMFAQKKIPYMQIDALFYWQDKWNSAEVKTQERYTNPDGHGMPIWQVERRIELFKSTGIVPWLFVVEKDTGLIFYERINVLEDKGRLKVTVKAKRVIWPIEHFIEITPEHHKELK